MTDHEQHLAAMKQEIAKAKERCKCEECHWEGFISRCSDCRLSDTEAGNYFMPNLYSPRKLKEA